MMKNDAMFNMIKESCTTTAPEILPKLSFDAAAEYKDTVPATSAKKSYIKAAIVYVAACIVMAVVIPFIIMSVRNTEPVAPPSSATENSINVSEINVVYNNADPETYTQKVTVEEVEKIISAARLAYDDYDVIVLSDGTKMKTTPKKPDITKADLEEMHDGDERHSEYKKYFNNMTLVVYDAISSRFSEKSTCVMEPVDYMNPPYVSFWVLDLEATAFTDSEIIEYLMFENGDDDIRYFCDIIAYGFGKGEKYYFAHYTETVGEETMLFPTEEEYEILCAELLPEGYSEYSLAIGDEILAADSSRTVEELIGHGYEEVTLAGDEFLMREFECETGDADFRVYTGLESDEEPYIEAFDYPYPELEDGKMRVIISIRVVDLLIKIRVTVDEGDPIILPEEIESELRYILNIEKEEPVTGPLVQITPEGGVIADDIRYLDSDVGYKFAVIEKDGKCGLINTDGEIILPLEYSSIDLNFLAPDDMRLRLQAVISSENEYTTYWIDTDGTLTENLDGGWGAEGGIGIYWMNGKPIMLEVIEGEIEYSVDRYTSDMVYKWSYAVASGKQSDVIPIREINSYISDNGWYYVREENLVSHKYALYNFRTKELITDFIFDDCGLNQRGSRDFVEGILAVKKDGKWGYVNESGEMITDFVYDVSEVVEYYGNITETMYYTLNGYTIVRQGDLFGLIDKNGEIVLDVKYDDISNVNPDGYVWVKSGNSWTVIRIS